MMRKSDLLIGCAAGALLAALAAPASAQSFQGGSTVVTGAAVITTGATTTNVFVNAPETVINWTAIDAAASGAINFQPVGTTATFQSNPAITNYTVLNRILPVDGIGNPTIATVSLNGTVNSVIVNNPGGQIWFYSPTAIIAGPTARFNVGSLLLTTNDIAFVPNPAGGFGSIYGPGGLVDFNGPAGSTGFVRIDSGAQVNATGANAYVALVAPRVVQRGLVQSNGQVAYVAAEQLDMTINGGLFDFVITVGTTDPDGIVHTGTTTGPASTGPADVQQIAMVALPKNDALTMLLSGSIGYSPAASGINDGSSVVLSAGSTTAIPTTLPANRLGSIEIGNATFSNTLEANATDAIRVAPAGNATDFARNATLFALNSIDLTAESEERISGGRDLLLHSGVPGTGGRITLQAQEGGLVSVVNQLSLNASSTSGSRFGGGPGVDAVGGQIIINADGGTITALESFVDAGAQGLWGGAGDGPAAVGGTISFSAVDGGSYTATNFTNVNASARGADPFQGNGGDGSGGSVNIVADGGTLGANQLFVSAGGNGGDGGIGGTGTGGSIDILASGDGTIQVAAFDANADGAGGSGIRSPGIGGNGIGGAVALTVSDGALDFGTVNIGASGRGGGGQEAGDAFGGTAAIFIPTGQHDWDELQIRADAAAGQQLASGTGLAGSAEAHSDAVRLEISGSASLTVAGELALTANSIARGNGAPGFSGRAGGVTVDVGSEGVLRVDGSILAEASSTLFMGEGVDLSPDSSPTQTGGTVSITVNGGSLTADRLEGAAHAYGLSGATVAGTATGGMVSLSALNGGSITIDNGAAGEASAILWANGYGSPGPIAGDSFGGIVQLRAEGGSISVNGQLELEASGLMTPFAVLPADGEGFDATGGTIMIDQIEGSGTSSITSASLRASALGDARVILDGGISPPGGEAVLGNGGIGTGGNVLLTLADGDLLGFSLALDSSGFGGASVATDGPTPFQSGSGTGGESGLVQSGGTADYVVIELLSHGVGGGGGPAATGTQQAALAGDGTGGSVLLSMLGGGLTAADFTLDATGTGADGMDHAGTGNASGGGNGFGGSTGVLSGDGATDIGQLFLRADGAGGSGANGGDGSGGTVNLAAGNDGLLGAGSFQANAGGFGGAGTEQGGDGFGGEVGIAISGGAQNWGELGVAANAFAGAPSDPAGRAGGAAARSDAIELTITGPGSLTVAGGVGLDANSYAHVDAAPGLTGEAGGIELTVADDGELTVDGTLSAEASAFFNDPANGPVAVSTPAQRGGTISIVADGGSIEAAHLDVRTSAEGRAASGTAGVATGGISQVVAIDGGSISLDDGAGTSQMFIHADGRGAPGPVAADAFGGTARIVTSDGSITVAGTIDLAANAVVAQYFDPPAAGDGFEATGGIAAVNMAAGSLGTGSISGDSLSISAAGDARFALAFGGGSPIEGNGGDGIGGTARLNLAAGTLAVAGLGIASVGTGGISAASAAATAFRSGDGAGGTAELVVGDGAATMSMLNLASSGYGGGGGPPASGTELAAHAGAGTGGTASVRLLGGSLSATDMVIHANGLGGNGMAHDGAGDGGNAGSAIGGSALLQSPAGWTGSLSTNILTVQASGLAGNAGASAGGANGDGGNGTGVSALVDLSDGRFAIGGMSIIAWAEAAGGVGTGGEARFTLIDSAGPVGARSIGELFIDASGFGPGGDTTLQSVAGNAVLTLRPLDAASAIDLTGQLGMSSFGSSAPVGAGIDVDMSGAPLTVGGQVLMYTSRDIAIGGDQPLQGLGDVIFEARALDTTGPIAANLSLQATASGGDIVTGDLEAGTWLYVEAAGSAELGNLTAAIDAAATARSGSLTVGDVSAGDDLWLSVFGTDPASVLTAGDLTTTGLGSDTAAGPPVLFGGYPGGAGPVGSVARVRSAGSLAIGDLATPGRAILVADLGTTAAGTLAADEALILLGRGDIDLAAATTDGRFYVADSTMFALLPDAYDPASLNGLPPVRTGGSLSATGAVDAGSVSLAVGGDATLQGVVSAGTTFLSGGGTIDIASLVSAGTVSATAGDSLFIDGSGPLTFTIAEALNRLSIVTSGNLAFAAVRSGLNLTLGSTTGSITATSDVAGAFANLSAADDIAIAGNLNSAGTLVATAGGRFSVTGDATADDANVTADEGITMASLRSGESTQLLADSGNILIDDLRASGIVSASGRNVDITSSGSLSFFEASASAGDVTIRTAGNLRAGRLLASDAIDLDSGGTFTLDGEARASTIDVDSSDIEIDDEVGRLGVRGVTSTVTLRNDDSESNTFIGGVAQNSDYSLDRGEAARVFADGSITLLAFDDITVGDLALSFGTGNANIGAGGRLEISTPDYVHITGDVMLRTTSADDTFRIDPRLVELDTDTGSISMFTGEGVGGTPLGRLQIIGDNIAIASTSALPQLRTLTDMAAINALLNTPGGSGQPLRAGTIQVTANGALFIQNSGTSTGFADRRGFFAGTLEITTATPTTRIAVNGQIVTAAGPVSGLDVAPLVRINDAVPAAGGRFDAASTINGCVIGGNCAPLPPPGPERPDLPSPPTSTDIESPVLSGDGAVSLFVAPVIELAATEPLVTPPLVDEPITGVGNDDLWEPRCDPDDETCAEADARP